MSLQSKPKLPSLDKIAGKEQTPVQKNSLYRSGLFKATCVAALVYLICDTSGRFSLYFCVVYTILAFVLTNGVLSLWQAIRWLKQDNIDFENRRKKEREQLPTLANMTPRERAQAPVFANAVAADQISGGITSTPCLHKERLKAILRATYPTGSSEVGCLPTLSDLRELSYTAERKSDMSWQLGVATSTLLISGILGTLVGVHDAIPISSAERMELAEILPALYPSAIAVFSTVLLLILRGWYRHGVERYIGRLDRHTQIGRAHV